MLELQRQTIEFNDDEDFDTRETFEELEESLRSLCEDLDSDFPISDDSFSLQLAISSSPKCRKSPDNGTFRQNDTRFTADSFAINSSTPKRKVCTSNDILRQNSTGFTVASSPKLEKTVYSTSKQDVAFSTKPTDLFRNRTLADVQFPSVLSIGLNTDLVISNKLSESKVTHPNTNILRSSTTSKDRSSSSNSFDDCANPSSPLGVSDVSCKIPKTKKIKKIISNDTTKDSSTAVRSLSVTGKMQQKRQSQRIKNIKIVKNDVSKGLRKLRRSSVTNHVTCAKAECPTERIKEHPKRNPQTSTPCEPQRLSQSSYSCDHEVKHCFVRIGKTLLETQAGVGSSTRKECTPDVNTNNSNPTCDVMCKLEGNIKIATSTKEDSGKGSASLAWLPKSELTGKDKITKDVHDHPTLRPKVNSEELEATSHQHKILFRGDDCTNGKTTLNESLKNVPEYVEIPRSSFDTDLYTLGHLKTGQITPNVDKEMTVGDMMIAKLNKVCQKETSKIKPKDICQTDHKSEDVMNLPLPRFAYFPQVSTPRLLCFIEANKALARNESIKRGKTGLETYNSKLNFRTPYSFNEMKTGNTECKNGDLNVIAIDKNKSFDVDPEDVIRNVFSSPLFEPLDSYHTSPLHRGSLPSSKIQGEGIEVQTAASTYAPPCGKRKNDVDARQPTPHRKSQKVVSETDLPPVDMSLLNDLASSLPQSSVKDVNWLGAILNACRNGEKSVVESRNSNVVDDASDNGRLAFPNLLHIEGSVIAKVCTSTASVPNETFYSPKQSLSCEMHADKINTSAEASSRASAKSAREFIDASTQKQMWLCIEVPDVSERLKTPSSHTEKCQSPSLSTSSVLSEAETPVYFTDVVKCQSPSPLKALVPLAFPRLAETLTSNLFMGAISPKSFESKTTLPIISEELLQSVPLPDYDPESDKEFHDDSDILGIPDSSERNGNHPQRQAEASSSLLEASADCSVIAKDCTSSSSSVSHEISNSPKQCVRAEKVTSAATYFTDVVNYLSPSASEALTLPKIEKVTSKHPTDAVSCTTTSESTTYRPFISEESPQTELPPIHESQSGLKLQEVSYPSELYSSASSSLAPHQPFSSPKHTESSSRDSHAHSEVLTAAFYTAVVKCKSPESKELVSLSIPKIAETPFTNDIHCQPSSETKAYLPFICEESSQDVDPPTREPYLSQKLHDDSYLSEQPDLSENMSSAEIFLPPKSQTLLSPTQNKEISLPRSQTLLHPSESKKISPTKSQTLFNSSQGTKTSSCSFMKIVSPHKVIYVPVQQQESRAVYTPLAVGSDKTDLNEARLQEKSDLLKSPNVSPTLCLDNEIDSDSEYLILDTCDSDFLSEVSDIGSDNLGKEPTTLRNDPNPRRPTSKEVLDGDNFLKDPTTVRNDPKSHTAKEVLDGDNLLKIPTVFTKTTDSDCEIVYQGPAPSRNILEDTDGVQSISDDPKPPTRAVDLKSNDAQALDVDFLDFLGSGKTPIEEKPKKKVAQPFTSDDPAENRDINDPEWNAVRLLETDEERYRMVRKMWNSKSIPNPHRNLTLQSYRSRRLKGSTADCITTVEGNSKRKRSASPEGVRESKRARKDTVSCTFLLDSTIQDQQSVFEEKQEAINQLFSQTMGAVTQRYNEMEHHIRNQYSFSFPSYLNKYELDLEIRELRHNENVERHCARHSREVAWKNLYRDMGQKLERLKKARDEIWSFNKFYDGLSSNFEPCTLLDKEQMSEVMELKTMYEAYAMHYVE